MITTISGLRGGREGNGQGKGCCASANTFLKPSYHSTTFRCSSGGEQARGWGIRGECRCKPCRAHSASNCCWLHQPSNCLCKQSGWLIKVLLWSAINCNWQIKRRTAWDRYFRSESKTYWELKLCFNSSTLLPAPSPLLCRSDFPWHVSYCLVHILAPT